MELKRGHRARRKPEGGIRIDLCLHPAEQIELEAAQKIMKENLGLPLPLSALLRAAVPVYLHYLCENLANPEVAKEFAGLEHGRVLKINHINPERASK
jgi:hypothetical protein